MMFSFPLLHKMKPKCLGYHLPTQLNCERHSLVNFDVLFTFEVSFQFKIWPTSDLLARSGRETGDGGITAN